MKQNIDLCYTALVKPFYETNHSCPFLGARKNGTTVIGQLYKTVLSMLCKLSSNINSSSNIKENI